MLSAYEYEALLLSLKVAAVAVAFSLPIGIMVARCWLAVIFPVKP